MNPALLTITREQIEAELCRRSFYHFFRTFWPTIESVELVENWHLEYLCNELQQVLETWERGEAQQDLVINQPPGTSKSTIVTQLFPAWCWVRNPQMRIINASYSGALSIAHAVKTRDCLRSELFQRLFPGRVLFKGDQDGKTDYRNTAGGQRMATSTAGTVTGIHADLILIDDPLSPRQATSETERAGVHDFLSATLASRKVDKERTVTITVMQRLHEDDPVGRALRIRADRVRHICLPGELTPDVFPVELRDRYVEGLFDPQRLSRSALARLRTDLGSAGYAGQILQRPAPAEGELLKKEWLGAMDWVAFQQMMAGRSVTWDIDADTAYTAKATNDPTALLASALVGNTLYIREVVEGWWEFPQLIQELPAFARRNGYTSASRIYIEPKAAGKSVVQTLRADTRLNVIEAPAPTDDKVTRVNAIAPFVEARRVVLLYNEPGRSQAWQEPFLAQLAGFPHALHDDQSDCLVQAVARAQKPRGGLSYAF